MLALGDRIRPWQRQRADIGLVGCIHPVALVLHLVCIAFEAADDLGAGCKFVSDRPYIEDGLARTDELRKFGLDNFPRDFLNGCRGAGHPGDRVEHDETGAIGQKIRDRLAVRRKAEPPIAMAADLGRIAELLLCVLSHGIIADSKEVPALFDLEIADLGIVGRPILIAYDKGYATQHLAAAIADVTQVARLEFGRKIAGSKNPRRLDRLLGAKQPDRARRSSHGALLNTCPLSRSISTARRMSKAASIVSPGLPGSWASSSAITGSPASRKVTKVRAPVGCTSSIVLATSALLDSPLARPTCCGRMPSSIARPT